MAVEALDNFRVLENRNARTLYDKRDWQGGLSVVNRYSDLKRLILEALQLCDELLDSLASGCPNGVEFHGLKRAQEMDCEA